MNLSGLDGGCQISGSSSGVCAAYQKDWDRAGIDSLTSFRTSLLYMLLIRSIIKLKYCQVAKSHVSVDNPYMFIELYKSQFVQGFEGQTTLPCFCPAHFLLQNETDPFF